jgi:VCBS repeat-containing protein
LTFSVGGASASPIKTFTGTLTDINNALNGLRFAPSANYNGSALLTVTVDDLGKTGAGDPKVTTVTVPITFTAVNDAPTATNDSYLATAVTTLTLPAPGVLANDADPEGSSLTAAQVSGPGHGSLTLASNGGFQYAPTAGYTGPDTFTYQASDGSLPSSAATVAITVNAAVNPGGGGTTLVASSDTYSVASQHTLTVPAPGVLANDTDGSPQSLTATKASDPAHGTVTVNGDGSFTYVPAATFFGTDSFTYRAGEGVNQSGTATVLITVVPTQCGPRPQVRSDLSTGGGKLLVHIEASALNNQQNNALKQITFGTPDNAIVTYNNQPIGKGDTINLPAATYAADFTVQRITPGQSTTVPFTIVDICGSWPSFVGGGTGATGF